MGIRISLIIWALIFAAFNWATLESASANVILCQGNKGSNKNKLVTKIPPKRCPKNFRTISTIPDVFGDASAGSVTITSTQQFNSLTNFQFENFTIADNSGDIQFPSGTIIRATGTCTINEEVELESSVAGGSITPFPRSNTRGASFQLSSAGHSRRGAANGEVVVSASETAKGGSGGEALDEDVLRSLLQPGPIAGGGGGGGGANVGSSSFGGSASGTLVFHCREGIVIGSGGEFEADGSNGAGFGAGGGSGAFILLTSRGSIVNNGSIDVSGGNGGEAGFDSVSNANYGPGGGGAGGVVHFIAPSVTAGTINITGGSGRASGSISPATTIQVGGAGGGAFGGDGGVGGDLLSTGTFTASTAGASGKIFATEGTPESLFQ